MRDRIKIGQNKIPKLVHQNGMLISEFYFHAGGLQMKLIDFVMDIIGSSLMTDRYIAFGFLDPTIKLWKERSQWIHDPTAPCKCQSYNPNIDRTTCPNKRQGGTCRKEILRDVFFPFIDQCQADNCPSLRELGRWIYWEKEEGETQFRRQRLHQFITHELGGAVDTLAAKNFWATYVIPEEWKPVMELCQDRKD